MSETAIGLSVGRRLRQQRKKAGLTQQELADLFDHGEISRSHISNIENGKKSASLETLEMLMNAMMGKLSDLFQYEGDNESERILLFSFREIAKHDKDLVIQFAEALRTIRKVGETK